MYIHMYIYIYRYVIFFCFWHLWELTKTWEFCLMPLQSNGLTLPSGLWPWSCLVWDSIVCRIQTVVLSGPSVNQGSSHPFKMSTNENVAKDSLIIISLRHDGEGQLPSLHRHSISGHLLKRPNSLTRYFSVLMVSCKSFWSLEREVVPQLISSVGW